MNSNSAFTIGRTHDVCQDYAVAGSSREPYVIVSDGCSSSPDTDIGSRLLARAAERLLRSAGNPAAVAMQELYEQAARKALRRARGMGLGPGCVDATLLTIHVYGDEFVAACYGDGVIALERRDGRMDVYSINFAESYPCYPAYAHQPERLRLIEERSGNVKEVAHYHRAGRDDELRLSERIVSDNCVETFSGSVADYAFVAVMTDGVHSFAEAVRTDTARRVEPVGMSRVLRELLAFKNTNGAFVQRRLNKFSGECRQRGWQHHDDLGIGAVYF
ncbi:MAG TPA: protein phosphatase 2C domain-containing protein [Blastocatellia bacterium]|nr:protein phosphatase 2C domain-containing protein [Blastocatellia bacterium]